MKVYSTTTAEGQHPDAAPQPQPTIALLPWGNLWEEFFDTINVSFEAFCNELAGGWMFNYIDALTSVGVKTVVFYPSRRVNVPTRYLHKHTGATVCLLPAPIVYRIVSRPKLNRLLFNVPYMDIGPYVATPLGLLAQELRRDNCQAILCQEYEFPRFDACVLLGQLMRIPVFATFQGSNFQLSRLERFVRPHTIKACAGLIIATGTEAKRVQERYGVPSEKVAQIFNPLDVVNWLPMDRTEARIALGLPIDAQIVIYHGRIEIERKGLDILMQAWRQVCRDRPEKSLRLLLVGTGNDAINLRELIEQLQLQGVIWVNEYVGDRDRIRQYLSAADVYTLASRNEGFPVAPIEAMALGLPVVAADAPGIPDILEEGEAHGGLVVPREDANALAKALGHVLDDEALGHELGQRARQRVEKYFSLEAAGKQLRNFLLKDNDSEKI